MRLNSDYVDLIHRSPLQLGVLITYHNEGPLLRECIESLTAGDRGPNEIIVYDDASECRPEEFIPRGAKVRIIRSDKNLGPAAGRNFLLNSSHSSFIHFHDADDLFHPDWAGRVRDALESSSVDVVFTEIACRQSGAVLSNQVLGLAKLINGGDLVRFCIKGVMLVPSGTYRRSVVERIDGYRTNLWQSEDFDFHIRLAISGVSYTIIRDPLVTIRIRPESRSSNHIEVWCSAAQAIAQLADEVPLQYKPDLAEAAVRAGSVLFKLGAYTEARKAFHLAKEIGPPLYSQQRRLYRAVARTIGPENTERLGHLYRRWFPENLRRRLARNNW